MKAKKINHLLFDETPEEEESLIALYSSVEIFRVVYHLNKVLEMRLERTEKDIDFVSVDSISYYPLYHFYDKNTDVDYYVVANKAKIKPTESDKKESLFKENSSYTTYLIPERKNVDYFFKIERRFEIENLLKKIKEIRQISAVHQEDISRIKSYKNLIFD